MKAIGLALSLLFTLTAFTQEVTNIYDVRADKDYENIHVKKLDSDSNSTSFIIWIKKGVKSHKHEHHSEVIYVIEGEGLMTVNGTSFHIGPGDYFRIPENTYHSLDVLSTKYIKVMSVQAPEFYGTDRIYDENDEMEFSKDKYQEFFNR